MSKSLIPCVILARKGSKGLKKKNTFLLNSKPLISYTIEYALKSKYISHIVVSTDDLDVVKIAKKYNCFIIYPRPKKLSNDMSKSEPAIKHALKNFEKKIGNFEVFAYLQITEPFRPKGILDKCIKNLLKNKKIQSSFAGYVFHKNFWESTRGKFSKINKNDKNNYLPRQKKSEVIREDTGVALASRYSLIKRGIRVGKKVKIEKYHSTHGLIDIHKYDDVRMAQILFDKKFFKN